MDKDQRVAAILGAADGLTLAVSLIFGRDPAVFHAALDAGIGEFVGMGAALYLSTPKRQFGAALVCGLATLLGCVLPAVPLALHGGWATRAASAAVAAAIGAVICRLRPERGWVAVTETYGVILTAAGICFAVSFI
jgi:VIT1/CCC1 family predicted Fe2+/Mn2+ transporter